MAAALVKSLKRNWLLWLVVAFVVILAAAFFAGFRPGPGLTLIRVGTLVVADIPAQTDVFVDQEYRGTSNGSPLKASLVPGTHSVIVDAPGMQPWNTVLTIESKTDLAVSPILVPKAPERALLTGEAATAAADAIRATVLPTEAAPLLVGCNAISISNNRVIAAPASGCDAPEYLCSEGVCAPTIVYSPASPIRSVIPFPGRTDAILVATGEWVNILDIDPRNPQFFAPLGRGTAPFIAAEDEDSIYLSDKDKFYSFSL